MHHAETVFLQFGAEVAGQFHTVKIKLFRLARAVTVKFSRFGIVPNICDGVNLAGQCAVTGRGFKDGLRQVLPAVFCALQTVSHFPREIVRGRVKVPAIVRGRHGSFSFSCWIHPGGVWDRVAFRSVRPVKVSVSLLG